LSMVGAVALVAAAGVGFWWMRRRIDRKELEMDPLAQPYPALLDAMTENTENVDAEWQRLFDPAGLEPDIAAHSAPQTDDKTAREPRVKQPSSSQEAGAVGAADPPVRGRAGSGPGA
jgi:hypothetical protein